jgi:hypothetical protein
VVVYGTAVFVSGDEHSWEDDSGYDHRCPPTIPRLGTLNAWVDIPNKQNNVKFLVPGPFTRRQILDDSTAYYSASAVAESDPGYFFADGQWKFRCQRIDPGGPLLPHFGHTGRIIGINPNQMSIWWHEECPANTTEDGSGCLEVEEYGGGGTPPEAPPEEWTPGCEWFEYKHYNWDGNGVYRLLYTWYRCE